MIPILLTILALATTPGHSETNHPTARSAPHTVGVLIMAHGGSAEWNNAVEAATNKLSDLLPTVVAFGMAEPGSLTRALDSLTTQGVTHVAVVRLFISGQSFKAQTEYLLGLSDTPPPIAIHHGPGAHAELLPIDHGLVVATHESGLVDADEGRHILAQRALQASRKPDAESVLLLAHGMGDEDENARVIGAMDEIAGEIATLPFGSIWSVALREDWIEKRAEAEHQIRQFVQRETSAGRGVIVVPVRLTGFGPYAEVLAGLDYTPTDGLLPHPGIADWIQRTATQVICANLWPNPIAPCPAPEGQFSSVP